MREPRAQYCRRMWPVRSRSRPVLRAPEGLGGLLDRIGRPDATGRQSGISRAAWERAVGARIAEHAQPVSTDKGVLVVRVTSSVWASELSFLVEPILTQLQAQGVGVRALRFRVGSLDVPVKPTALRAYLAVPAPEPLPAELARVVEGIEDAELRAIVRDAAQANLAWQAYVGGPEDAAPPGGQQRATSAASRAARVPRYAAPGSTPPGQTSAGDRGASRRRP